MTGTYRDPADFMAALGRVNNQFCTILIFAREDQEFQEKPEAFVLPCRTRTSV
eukprot:COSAG03_NODE_1273_length_4422_cov_2.115198_6_plen_52_part_01